MTQPVVIVGGGVGGMATAIHLAQQGRKVLILEKTGRVGGKMNIVQEDGFTFDTGPSLFTMPAILRDLFAAAGRNFDDYLSIDLVEPSFRYFWPDGTQFEASQKLPLFVQEVARLSPPDVANYFRFLGHIAQVYRRVADPFLFHAFTGIKDFLRPELVRDGWRIDAFQSVDQTLQKFFHSPYLRQIFNHYPSYNGSSPYESPGTFNVIAYVELAEGVWYIRGGMYQLVRAIQQLCTELGVEIRTRSEVSNVLLEGKTARGVRLTDGEEIEASCVVINADPHYAYQTLLPGQQHKATALDRLQPSASGFIMLLGINHIYEHLNHHNLFYNDDYRLEFDAISRKQVPAVDPSVYVCSTCLSDPQHAPPGHMNLFFLINAPPLTDRVNWESEKAPYRDMIIRRLERMGLTDLHRHIVFEKIITPLDMQRYYHASRGAIYGLASNNPLSAFMRPKMKPNEFRRLYFVGGGTHPGGGIPLVALSGKAVAQHIASDKYIP